MQKQSLREKVRALKSKKIVEGYRFAREAKTPVQEAQYLLGQLDTLDEVLGFIDLAEVVEPKKIECYYDKKTDKWSGDYSPQQWALDITKAVNELMEARRN